MASYWSNWIQSENSEKTIVLIFELGMGHLFQPPFHPYSVHSLSVH